ncbi:DUF3649 domain-containing protein [Luteimonas sp. SX5]|uniref:DUF3649 domain-containing protein n=1 Tax=Luteimonas galliterrae TaxID=2940486 RepID=A0ABT0MHA7_9GAMM|nr:DUF3649 domain-containing protein [Luteimonas galliterrae]
MAIPRPLPVQSVRAKRRGVPAWTAASRVLAALLAGYWVAWGSTAFLTLALPMSRANRVTTASLLCFAVWTAAAMYAFAARSSWRAWWVLLLAGGIPYAIALLCGDWAMRP